MRLSDYRKRIDELDDQILKLLHQRVDLSQKIGEFKKSHNLPILDSERESKVLEKARTTASKIGYDSTELESIFNHILISSRRAQGENFNIAYLGPPGTFCEQAARSFFASYPSTYKERQSIADVFRSVNAGEDDFGVVPVENSIEGSVNITLDLLLEYDLRIYGEIEERIRHHLIAKSRYHLSDIRVVLSHPQALAQCRKFLETNLPGVEAIEEVSTARAVKKVMKLKEAAAIGTELAASIYGLNILAKGIENTPDNYTRFFVLSHRQAQPTGRDKTSIVYSIPHLPGSLQRSLETFAKRKINLTKIESRPARKASWEYVFYCDFEGHREEKKYSEALKEFDKKCTFLKILGSYPRAR